MALSSSSTTTSSAASPPPPFSSSTLWHPRFSALAWLLPYNFSYDHRHHHVPTIWISAIIFITAAPMSPYRPRQGAHAACYDRKKFYRLSGARSPQCVTQAALWIAELWWPGHIYLSPLLDNAYNLKIVHIFFQEFEQTCKDLLRGGILLTCEIGLGFWALGIKWLLSATSLLMCNPVRKIKISQWFPIHDSISSTV